MSTKEKIYSIVDTLPEYKLAQILIFLQGIQFDDELEDDLFCEQLYQRYLDDPDPHKHDVISLEDLAAREGIAL